MQLTLIDLLLFEALAAMGAALGWGIGRLAHLSRHLSSDLLVCGAVAAVLVFSWPIRRHFHFRPLCLPPCPSCRKIPDAYF